MSSSIKELLRETIRHANECGALSQGELQNIIDFDPHPEYLEAMQPFCYPSEFEVHKKPDFCEFEQRLGIELHPDIREYFSSFWSASVMTMNRKSVSQFQSNHETWLLLLTCPADLNQLAKETQDINSELGLSGNGIWVPIARKLDGLKLVVNNETGKVGALGYYPIPVDVTAASICAFLTP